MVIPGSRYSNIFTFNIFILVTLIFEYEWVQIKIVVVVAYTNDVFLSVMANIFQIWLNLAGYEEWSGEFASIRNE